MRRNKVEVTVYRGTRSKDGMFFTEDIRGFIEVKKFRKLFGFTPRPGKRFKITMEIQEESK